LSVRSQFDSTRWSIPRDKNPIRKLALKIVSRRDAKFQRKDRNQGIPVKKSSWAHLSSVENALIYSLEVKERRRAGERVVPFQVERVDYRENDREGFSAGLSRNSPRSGKEFQQAF